MLRQALSLNKEALAYIVPTKQNPLKESPGSSLQLIEAWMSDLADELSKQQFSRCVLELSEFNSEKEKSYTIETLEGLHQDHQNIQEKTEWILLLGSDSALSLDKWKNPEKLISLLSEIWVVPRKNVNDSSFSIQETQKLVTQKLQKLKAASKLKFLKTVSDISSTELREKTDGATSQLLDEYLSPHVREVWKKL
jgi:nicotinic acid mononucleotide adenylyltransferase